MSDDPIEILDLPESPLDPPIVDFSTIDNIANSMSGQMDTLTATMGSSCDIFGSLGLFIDEKLAAILTSIQQGIGAALTGVGNVLKSIKSAIDSAKSVIGDIVKKIATFATQLANAIRDGITDLISSLTEKINGLKGSISDFMSGFASALSGIAGTIGSAIGGIVSFVNGLAGLIGDGLKFLASASCSGVQSALGSISGGAGGLSSATDSIISAASGNFNLPNISAIDNALISGATTINDSLNLINDPSQLADIKSLTSDLLLV